jgi:hypothetical protein
VVTCPGGPDVHTVIVDDSMIELDGNLTIVHLPELRHATCRIRSVTSQTSHAVTITRVVPRLPGSVLFS